MSSPQDSRKRHREKRRRSLEIPGRVEFVHPLHNLAVVSYDPALLGETPVKSAVFADSQFAPGEELYVVGLSPDHSLRSQSSEVDRVTQTNFPISSTLRFRDTNLDVVELVNGPNDFDGVIVDRLGRVLRVSIPSRGYLAVRTDLVG